MHYPPSHFLRLGLQMMGRWKIGEEDAPCFDNMLRFTTQFGTSPENCSLVWTLLWRETPYMNTYIKPKHLLWALVLMKVYSKETVLCSMVMIVGMDKKPPTEKTFRNKAWYMIEAIASLEGFVIGELWSNRTVGTANKKELSTDGIDCSTYERSPFWKGNYSVKFNGPGVRYEVVVDIENGYIIRLDGPHRAGIRDDTIFIDGTMKELEEGEVCEGDRLYRKQLSEVFTGDASEEEKEFANKVRARHETANARLKRWSILSDKYRSTNWEKHGRAFRAVAVLSQLEIENGMPLFSIED